LSLQFENQSDSANAVPRFGLIIPRAKRLLSLEDYLLAPFSFNIIKKNIYGRCVKDFHVFLLVIRKCIEQGRVVLKRKGRFKNYHLLGI
jgi:hypothetical protein